jgi:hypothetical protein
VNELKPRDIRVGDKVKLKPEMAKRFEVKQECTVTMIAPGADCSLTTEYTGKLRYSETIFKVTMSDGHQAWLPTSAFESIAEADL